MRSALVLFLVATSTQVVHAQQSSSSARVETEASAAGVRALDPVARIALVKARDAHGRVDRFADAADREFKVYYDPAGRVTAARAIVKEHISDVRSVGYDAQGRLAGAQLGSRYLLLVNYLEDGTQIIRDRFGGLISRQGDPGSYRILQTSDPTGRLVAVVNGLDELLQLASR